MLIVAGVIDTTSNYVEHPEVVADRIEAVVSSIEDPQRVIVVQIVDLILQQVLEM
ncbi:MAG: hypothetical protein Ct9H300mP20_17190 [Gammaproteobacteria bacterium]|nr:MAG: hypothetical protein Ct9H300mP20_17190 [Gammaproteobacteria bacterium]